MKNEAGDPARDTSANNPRGGATTSGLRSVEIHARSENAHGIANENGEAGINRIGTGAVGNAAELRVIGAPPCVALDLYGHFLTIDRTFNAFDYAEIALRSFENEPRLRLC
ncbi:hypothetical protein EVAR_25685_1 [Eumeta japonica]|uniref:Uncharacterized protein n=1 Tax=Eumeta variegata TaxID=151549 RepID=A0A4C1WEB3_EUMVA|nr:hypothetical protein EVAR_25685_1 [Eumeta japonica]